MEFDSEGRLILPGSVKKELDNEKRGIILTKIQVSSKSPAVAQLKIAFGSEAENKINLIHEMRRFVDVYVRLNFHDVDKDVSSFGENIIVESKGSMRMYSFLSGLVVGIRERFSGYNVAIKGNWAVGF